MPGDDKQREEGQRDHEPIDEVVLSADVLLTPHQHSVEELESQQFGILRREYCQGQQRIDTTQNSQKKFSHRVARL